jgi:hypothetical protein
LYMNAKSREWSQRPGNAEKHRESVRRSKAKRLAKEAAADST